MKQMILVFFMLLATVLHVQNDLNVLLQAGDAYLYSNQYDKALVFYNKGLTLAEQQGNKNNEALFLSNIAYVHHYKNELSVAQDYYERARVIGEDIGDDKIMGQGYLNLGMLNNQKGLRDKALRELLQAQLYFEKAGELECESSALNSLGNVENDEGNHLIALEYYTRALLIRQEYRPKDKDDWPELKDDIFTSLNNIGDLHKEMKKYGMAEFYLKKALALRDSGVNASYPAYSLNSLGEVYEARGQKQAALRLYTESYKLSKQQDNPAGIAASAILIGRLRLQDKDFTGAKVYIKEAETLATKDSLNDELHEVYDLNRQLFRQLDQPYEALYYDSLYIALNQVLFDRDSKRSRDDMEAKYENARQKEIQKERDDKFMFWLSIMGTALLGLAIVLFVIFKANRANKRAKHKIESLWRELNHRVKNNLQVLASMVSLQAAQVKDDPTRILLKEMENRVKAMGVIHRKLYMNDELTLVNISVFIQDLIEDLKISYGFDNLELSCKLDEFQLSADRAIPLGLIINEVMSNAFKYAFTGNPNPELTVELHSGGTQMTLTIRDNGPGMPETAAGANSFGLRLIRIFCKQLDADLSITNNGGTRVQLTLPS